MRPDNMPRPHLPEHSEPRTDTETLIKAGHILARDIQSDDGVANAAIAEMADRLAELQAEVDRLSQLLVATNSNARAALESAKQYLDERDELRRRIESADRHPGWILERADIVVDGDSVVYALVALTPEEQANG